MNIQETLINSLNQCGSKIGMILIDSKIPFKLLDINSELWNTEEKAFTSDDFVKIGKLKQEINRLNKNRHKCIEEIDQLIIKTYNSKGLGIYPNSETPGQLIDRILILYLRFNKTEDELIKKSVRQQYDFLESMLIKILNAIEAGIYKILEQPQYRIEKLY